MKVISAIFAVALFLITSCQTNSPATQDTSQDSRVLYNPNNPCAGKTHKQRDEFIIGTYGDFTDYFFRFESELDLDISVYKADWGEHHTNITKNFVSCGQLADIEIIDTYMIQGYLNNNHFVDLTEKFAPYKKQLLEYTVALGQDIDKTQRAIPIDAGPSVLIYRRNYMQDIGLDPKVELASWESWLDYGRKLKSKHNVYLVDNIDTVVQSIIYGSVEEDGYIFIDDQQQILIENERFKYAFNIAKTLIDEKLVANTGQWNDKWYKGFKKGAFATNVNFSGFFQHLKSWIAPQTSGEWGMSLLPDNTFTYLSGSYAVIPKGTHQLDKAWKVIEHIIDAQNQIDGYLAFNDLIFPTNVESYNDRIFMKPDSFANGQKVRQTIIKAAQNIKPLSTTQYDNVAHTLVINNGLDELKEGNKDINAILKEAAYQLKRRLR